jgi:N-acetylneuraminic acid mutarotase
MKLSKNALICNLLFISLLFLSLSCNKDDNSELIGNWVEQSVYEGKARSDAASFVIGNIGYAGTGYNGDEDERYTDFWAYDSDRNTWTQIADFPGEARNGAFGFSANGKGYVGAGYTGEVRLNDLYAYDPVTNSWERKADFAGTARYGAVAFSINDVGYVGTGYDGNYLKDFYAYYPLTDTWEAKTSYFGNKRRDAVAFVIDGLGYVCTGINNGTYENDFYAYDPTTDEWIVKRKIANVSKDEKYDDAYTIVRSNAVAIVINGKAYVATGTIGNLKNDVWEYNPKTDLWSQMTSFEGTTRKDAVAFSTASGRGFVATGSNVSSEFDDNWEFKPHDPYEEDD